MYSLKNNFKADIFVTVIQVKKENITIIVEVLKLQYFIPYPRVTTPLG